MNKQYANETMKLLYERGSCRQFQDKKISDELLNEVIGAGLHSATGGNLQPYSIIKITDDKNKEKLFEVNYMQSFIKQAPVNLLFCVDWRYIKRWAEANNAPFVAYKSYLHFLIALEDTIIAAQSICTAADSVGLGSVYVGTVLSFLEEIAEILEIPEGVFPVVIVSLGYPVKKPEIKGKLGISGIVHNEKYKDIPIEELNKLQDEKYEYKQFPASKSNIEEIYEVAEEVGGKKYADDMIKSINEKGYVNMAQRYFGLHYVANLMASENSNFMKTLKKFGFSWIDGTG